jgi:hypothetical protein
VPERQSESGNVEVDDGVYAHGHVNLDVSRQRRRQRPSTSVDPGAWRTDRFDSDLIRTVARRELALLRQTCVADRPPREPSR